MTTTPIITALRVVPVAGEDSMLLNLSGAHGPLFTRNILILTDSAGRTGLGEVPGGEAIARTLEDSRELVVGREIGAYRSVLRQVGETFAGHGNDAEGGDDGGGGHVVLFLSCPSPRPSPQRGEGALWRRLCPHRPLSPLGRGSG